MKSFIALYPHHIAGKEKDKAGKAADIPYGGIEQVFHHFAAKVPKRIDCKYGEYKTDNNFKNCSFKAEIRKGNESADAGSAKTNGKKADTANENNITLSLATDVKTKKRTGNSSNLLISKDGADNADNKDVSVADKNEQNITSIAEANSTDVNTDSATNASTAKDNQAESSNAHNSATTIGETNSLWNKVMLYIMGGAAIAICIVGVVILQFKKEI